MQVAADERFSASEPQLVDSERRDDADEPLDFFEAEQLRPIHEFNVLCRHAVETANVAAIGDADSQVVVNSAKAVD